MGLVSELRRRNVFRMALLYLGAAWLIMQVVDLLIDRGPLPESIGPITLTVLAIGFPIALIISWFYELTPEGISLDTDEELPESATGVTGRRVDFVIISLLVAAVLVFAYDKWYLPSPLERSVAVLPFVPMTSGEDDGYFADGLTEEILNGLAQLPELQVTARTSSFFFKGQDLPIPEIADRLKVAHIVEGSVRRDGGRLRITSQLIRAADGFHLWSQTYDRPRDDIFAVQQDIAEKIAESLSVVLDDNARERMRNVGIRDVEAFIAYQKGLEANHKAHQNKDPNEEGNYVTPVAQLELANSYFDEALEAVPGLAVARVMRADAHWHVFYDIAHDERDEEYPGEEEKALAAYRDAFDLAMRLSPPGKLRDNLQLQRILIGENWTGLGARIQKALQPGGCVNLEVTYAPIIPFGWAEQVAERYRELIACDPMNLKNRHALARALLWTGMPEEALRVGDEAASRDMRYGYWGFVRLQALLAAGRVDDAMVHLDGSEHVAGIENMRPIFRAALAGDAELARQLVEENCPTALGCAAIAGDRERANEIAARTDAHPSGTILLAGYVRNCLCGAPFDLEAAPNYKARIEEAGFTWPPVTIIDYPTKDW